MALFSIVLMATWIFLGYYITIWVTGLESINPEVLEAASIDGATELRILGTITLPLLKPTAFFITVIAIVGSFETFVPFYVMTHGGPAEATRALSYLIWQVSFNFSKLGYGASLSVVTFLILSVLSLLTVRMFRK
jgi:ABC-type sugar transport system permease subunit